MRKTGLLLVLGLLSGCGNNRDSQTGGDKHRLCPDGTVNAQQTIVTVNCSTVVDLDGIKAQGSAALPSLVAAGLTGAEGALREIEQSSADAQRQFAQMCESFNSCNLKSEVFQPRLAEAQAHFRLIDERLAGLKAASGKPEALRMAFGELYAAAVSSAQQANSQLSLELTVEAKEESFAPRVLRNGETLRRGTQIAFGVTVSQPAYVYVFQKKGASQALEVLLAETPNPVPAGTLLRLPPKGEALPLNQQELGRQDVYVAVSKQPLSELAAALRNAGMGPSAPSQSVERATMNVFEQGSPECAGKQRGLLLTAAQGCGSFLRGLTTNQLGTDSAKLTLVARTRPGDSVILQTFSFTLE